MLLQANMIFVDQPLNVGFSYSEVSGVVIASGVSVGETSMGTELIMVHKGTVICCCCSAGLRAGRGYDRHEDIPDDVDGGRILTTG